MDSKSLKAQLLDQKFQILTTDHSGVILDSDNTLFKVKKGGDLGALDPFFEAVLPLSSEDTDKLEFPCINLELDDKELILDIQLDYHKDKLVLILCDLTEHYNRSHPVVQEKNENTILANKLLLEQAIANEKEALKNSFLTKLSHEVRKPLSNMMGFVNLLQDSSLSYEQTEMLKIVRQTGLHIEELLNDLLDISKISQGTLGLKKVQFKIKDVTKHVSDMFSIKARSKRIDFEIVIRDNVPAT